MRFVRGAVAVMGGHAAARAARRAAALFTAVPLAVAGVTAAATPAAAAPTQHRGGDSAAQGGATATLEGLETYGQAVVREGGEELTTGAGISEMSVDGGGRLQTYGLDVYSPTQQQVRYGETDWKRTSLHGNPDAGKILWILRHSYPQVNDLQALAKKARSGKLTPQTAAAGTQVAIWRFTDGRGSGKGGGVRVNAVDPAAEKLADHLQASARRMAEPEASLSLAPGALSRQSGSRLGPFTVRTQAAGASVSQTPGSATPGAKVVGGDGKPVTTAGDGSRIYLDVPQDRRTGTGSLTVQAVTKIPVGRAFAGTGGGAASQAQILAGSSQSTVTATATVDWADYGPVPAADAEKDCAKKGVSVTVANAGSRPMPFRLAGEAHTLAAGDSRTYTVPVREDQAYRIPLTGPRGLRESFRGVLDCATRSSVPATDEDTAGASGLRTATVGGGGAEAAAEGGDLAETGTGSTPVIAGTAVGLVVIGAMAVLAVRRKNPDDAGVH